MATMPGCEFAQVAWAESPSSQLSVLKKRLLASL
jgi:hypothetical protein